MPPYSHTGRVLRIAITPGEPAGIGPDLVVGLGNGVANVELVVIADQQLLKSRAQSLHNTWNPDIYRDDCEPQSGGIQVLHVPVNSGVVPGKLNPINADYVLQTLAVGCYGCINGTFDALVTGPVHKGIINQAGYRFTGHTEWLAERCGGDPVMMLVTPGLRVALVTTHLPLSQVSAAITAVKLEQVARTLYQALTQRFGLVKPKILVCGLNPHAGEGGHLGREEQDIIEPVLQSLRTEGMDFIGPLPADTLFIPQRLQAADAVLAMYHDQGLPVLKHMGFGKAVNITLGLSIIRVSVDHGTALDLAGTGTADAGSLNYALKTAIELSGSAGILPAVNLRARHQCSQVAINGSCEST